MRTDADEIALATGLFKALGDETRLRIVALLSHGELCVCHFEAALEIPQPTVSRHLGVLRQAGVVEARRDGSWMYYRLAEAEGAVRERVLAAVVKAFGDDAKLKRDHARLRRTAGPGRCT